MALAFLYCNVYAAVFLLFKEVISALNVTFKYAPVELLLPSALHLLALNEVIFGAVYGRTFTSHVVDAVLPLESVTVVCIVNVPLPDSADVVTLAVVYVLPSILVLYDLIVEPWLPDALTSIFSFDLPCTYAPYVVRYV